MQNTFFQCLKYNIFGRMSRSNKLWKVFEDQDLEKLKFFFEQGSEDIFLHLKITEYSPITLSLFK